MEAMAMMRSGGCPAAASSRTSKPDLRFADQSHLRYYSSRFRSHRNRYRPQSGSGFFEMKVASDESVAEVIQQLEELQTRVKSKQQETKGKNKSKPCKDESSSSSSSESSSDEDECSSSISSISMNAAQVQAQVQARARAQAAVTAAGLGSVCTKVEVCTGGKCKKNGSQQVLAAFQAKGESVAASACKCMNKCDIGPNVRIGRTGFAVVHSGVAPQDVDGLLQQQQAKESSYCYL